MDLTWLTVFREVAARGSLSAAAQALGYTQPAVSRQISALEQATGAHLFDRLPRGVRLTDQGLCMLAHAEAILDRMRAAQQDLDDLRDLGAGRLRAGAFASADAALVPKALAVFRAAHPSVSTSVLEGTSAAILGRLQNGEIDVAVISAYPHETLDTGHFATHHLLDDPLMVAMPSGHRLAGPGREALRLAELAGESWIEGFPASAQTLTDACLRAGFRPQIDFTVREWTAKLGFVSAGLGLTLLPFLAALAIPPGIVLRPLHPDDAPIRGVYAATWRGIATPPPVTTFLDCLEAAVRELQTVTTGPTFLSLRAVANLQYSGSVISCRWLLKGLARSSIRAPRCPSRTWGGLAVRQAGRWAQPAAMRAGRGRFPPVTGELVVTGAAWGAGRWPRARWRPPSAPARLPDRTPAGSAR